MMEGSDALGDHSRIDTDYFPGVPDSADTLSPDLEQEIFGAIEQYFQTEDGSPIKFVKFGENGPPLSAQDFLNKIRILRNTSSPKYIGLCIMILRKTVEALLSGIGQHPAPEVVQEAMKTTDPFAEAHGRLRQQLQELQIPEPSVGWGSKTLDPQEIAEAVRINQGFGRAFRQDHLHATLICLFREI